MVSTGQKYSFLFHDAFIVSLLVLLAIITRGLGFWEWPLHGDEFYTIEHSLEGKYGIKPGYYVISNLIFGVLGVHEWTARITAVIFSIATVPVLYFSVRQFINRDVAIYAVLIMLVTEWHLYHSQFARFYSAVFFFGILSYFLYFFAVQSGKIRLLVFALISNLLGILFHPTAVIAPASCVVFSLIIFLSRRRDLSEATLRVIKAHILIAVISSLIMIPVAIKLLSVWQSMNQEWGYSGVLQLLQLAKYTGLVVFVSSFFGLIMLLKNDRDKGLFLLVALGCAIVFLVVFSMVTNMRPDYVFYALPLFIVVAGYFCNSIKECFSGNILLSHSMILLLIASLFPEFASYYTSRLTLDIRDVTSYIEKHYRDGDRILPLTTGFETYSKLKTEDLPRNAFMSQNNWHELLKDYRDSQERLWIIVPLKRSSISGNLSNWLGENTNLVWQKQAKRMDYTLEGYQIYLKR